MRSTCCNSYSQVLSVIAQQLLVLREGRVMGKPDINFMGVQIALKDHHVIITMNPGYAGRTELPDNLAVSATAKLTHRQQSSARRWQVLLLSNAI